MCSSDLEDTDETLARVDHEHDAARALVERDERLTHGVGFAQDGAVERSLHGAAFISLGLVRRPAVVFSPQAELF